jgi:hypothetical protein
MPAMTFTNGLCKAHCWISEGIKSKEKEGICTEKISSIWEWQSEKTMKCIHQ